MANKLPPLPVGVAPGSGYWNDWYEKLRTLINSFAAGFPFSSITSLPTTLSGYGITDAQKAIQEVNTIEYDIAKQNGLTRCLSAEREYANPYYFLGLDRKTSCRERVSSPV